MRIVTFIMALLWSGVLLSQQRPSTFPEKLNASDLDAIYTQEDGVNRKLKFYVARRYFSAAVNPVSINYTPGVSGNVTNLGEFVKVQSTQDVYYIDGYGRSTLILPGSNSGVQLWKIDALADTSTLTSADLGAIAYTETAIAFRDTSRWLVFQGGDDWGGQAVITDSSLAGDGTTGNPLGVSISYLDSAYLKTGGVSIDNLSAEIQNGLYPSAAEVPYTPSAPLTATNVQAAIGEVNDQLESVVGQSLGNNTIFISQAGGNDTTAIPGNIFKPFKTFDAGIAAAGPNALVIVFPGSYQWSGSTYAYTSTPFKIYCYPGVKIKQTGSAPLCRIVEAGAVMVFDQLHGDSLDRASTLFFDQSSSPSTPLKRIDITANYIRSVRNSVSTWGRLFFSENVQADTFNMNVKQIDFFGHTLVSIRKSKYINIDFGNVSFVNGPIGGRFDEYFFIFNPLSGDVLTDVDLSVKVATYRNLSTDFEKHGVLSIGNLNRNFVRLQANVDIGTYSSNSNRGTISHAGNRSLFSSAFNINGSLYESTINYKVESVENDHSVSLSNNSKFIGSRFNYAVNSARSKYRLFDLGQSDGDQADSIINSVFNFFFNDVVISDDCVINFNLASGIGLGNIINVRGNLSVTKPATPVIYTNKDIYLTGGCRLTVASSSQPAIEAPSPITVYIDNAFSTNSVAIDPDITFVNVGDKWSTATFVASSGQSAYTVTGGKLPTDGANVRVIVNGLERIEGVSEYYTYVPSTGVITFVTPFAGGEKVKISWYD